MVKVKDLSYAYKTENSYLKKAVKNISFSLENGEILGIMGKTGSGKSTLVRMLNGLLTPTSGEIIIDGESILNKPKKQKELFFKIGLVFQHPEHQLFESSVLKDISFGLKNKGLSNLEINKRIKRCIENLEIDPDTLYCSPFNISGGEKRKCAIAGVLAMEPEILILDEPTAGMDYNSRNSLIKSLRRYHQEEKKIIIFISHNLDEILELSTKILVMDSGESIYCGNSGGLTHNKKVFEILDLENREITNIISILRKNGYALEKDILTISQAKEAITKLLNKDGA